MTNQTSIESPPSDEDATANDELGVRVVRPWGSYCVIDRGDGYQVKRLEVIPGGRLSYQTHQRRSEHWFIVEGAGSVTVDGVERRVHAGQSVDVAIGAAHRIANAGNDLLRFIEVQRGSYLGEDDIVRLDDDYGRTAAERPPIPER